MSNLRASPSHPSSRRQYFMGVVEVLEGDWKSKTLVMLEFESMEQAQQWYKSPAYTRAKDIRLRAASTNVILVEGV